MSIEFNVADVFKLPVKIFAAITLGTGLILFLPDDIISKIYLFEITAMSLKEIKAKVLFGLRMIYLHWTKI